MRAVSWLDSVDGGAGTVRAIVPAVPVQVEALADVRRE